MYKLSIYYEGELVTYTISPHKQLLEFVRDAIEEEYKNTLIKYRFYIDEI